MPLDLNRIAVGRGHNEGYVKPISWFELFFKGKGPDLSYFIKENSM